MALSQMQWITTGWSGGPGYTSFYSSTTTAPELQTILAAQRAFFTSIQAYLPSSVTVTPPANYRIADEATGDLEDILPVTTPLTPVSGTGSSAYAAPSGVSVNWLTVTPAVSRLVVGRTYIVPTVSAAYQTDGTLSDAVRTIFQNAASTLVAASVPIMVIWRRPPHTTPGSVAPVVAARVNDRVSVLKSRRA